MADGQLAVVAVDPIEIADCLASIRNELPTLVEAVSVSRLVVGSVATSSSIDTYPGLSASVSSLELMDGNRANWRNEIYDFIRGLKNAGLTTLLTSEATEARRTPRGMVSSRISPMPSSTSTVSRTTSARPGWQSKASRSAMRPTLERSRSHLGSPAGEPVFPSLFGAVNCYGDG
ncbi:hypothetical protein BDK88_1156 [Natrinema hispanicum]|uniref:Uncharacterized protein n=1 Tax=Natrinema hispanicum TaxID=392421 RepID=A0A482YGJ9_9EURY|nr:hypothetical protein BDK88_1156 [Natrinema hispanicum]